MKLFSAEWCNPCRAVKLFLEDYSHNIEIVDVDLYPASVREHNIRGVPSLLLDNGDLIVGPEKIKEEIRKVYGKA